MKVLWQVGFAWFGGLWTGIERGMASILSLEGGDGDKIAPPGP